MTFEIEIRGALLDQHLPVGTPYGDTGNKITVPPTVDVEVVAAIDAAEAEGARRLLVIVDSFGGWVACAHAVAARLRRFSREVGPVVAYVVKADSSAPAVALAADYVVLDPAGRFLIHGAGGHDRPRTHEVMAAAPGSSTGSTAPTRSGTGSRTSSARSSGPASWRPAPSCPRRSGADGSRGCARRRSRRAGSRRALPAIRRRARRARSRGR